MFCGNKAKFKKTNQSSRLDQLMNVSQHAVVYFYCRFWFEKWMLVSSKA